MARTGSPGFPQLNVENAIVSLQDEAAQNTNATVEGQTYAGISIYYLMYLQVAGSFKLLPAEVTVKYASEPPESIEARRVHPFRHV